MKRKKLIYVMSDLERAPVFELIDMHIDKTRFDFQVVLVNARNSQTYIEGFFRERGTKVTRLVHKSKKDFPKNIRKLYSIFRKEKPDIVHAHLINAVYSAMAAAWLARVPMRVYTRWHSDYHHRYFPQAVKYDRLANRLATHIVAPGLVAEHVLVNMDGVKKEKVSVISPPFELGRFANPDPEEVKIVTQKYNPEGRKPVIGVISRFTELKGIQYIIPAVARVLEDYPDLLLMLFNAKGDYADEIHRMLKEQLPARNYLTVEFELMNTAIYQVFDVFVHVPISKIVENTGGVYTEALPAGIPSVFTLSGVIPGRVEHMRDCYIAEYEDNETIYKGIKTILDNPEIAQRFRENGPKTIGEEFTIQKHIEGLNKLYGVN